MSHPFRADLAVLVANLEAAHADDLLARHFTGVENETLLYCVREDPAAAAEESAGFALSDTCRFTDAAGQTDQIRQVDSGFLSGTPRDLLLQGIDLAKAKQQQTAPVATPAPAPKRDLRLERDLRRAEVWSLALTALALLVCYRSLPIAFLAMASGGMIVAVTVGALTLVAQQTVIPFVAVSIASLLALALGADLASLTAVAAAREGRLIHRSAVVGCAGVAAVFAVFALFPPAGLRALALIGVVAAAVALAGAWTLIPVLYRLLQRLAPRAVAPTTPRWSLLRVSIRASRRHALLTAVVAVAMLLPAGVTGVGVLHAPGSTLPPDTYAKPDTPRLQIAADTERLLRGTVEFVLDSPRNDASERSISRLLAAVGHEPAFAAPVFVQWSADGAIGVVTVFAPNGDAAAALDAARRVQGTATEPGAPIAIGGPVMLGAQVDAILQGWSLWAALGAAALALLVVLAGFGTPLLSGTVMLGALLSAAAGIGLLAWLGRRGIEAGPFALTAQPHLDPWTPLIVACLVLAVSTSYAGLVLGQRRTLGGGRVTDDEAFAAVLGRAPQLTSAASLSMIAIGIGFTASGIPAVQQAGAGLALALALESTVVRGALTPALLRFFARPSA